MVFVVFDIETRVDKQLLNRVFFPNQALADEEAYQRFRDDPRNRGGDVMPVTLQVPVSIAIGEVGSDYQLRTVECLAVDNYSEKQLVREFWRFEESFDGVLVSFNGRGFDLPVLELMALRYGISAPKYFEGPNSPRLRNAVRHLDLYDWLCNFGATGLRGGLDLLLKMVGQPGKTTLDGSRVQEYFEAGRIGEIHRYCRSDVLQTYLLFLRVELIRGRLDEAMYRSAQANASRMLEGLVAATTAPVP